MKNKAIYWCAFITLVFLCLPITALAADNPVGVAYRGHIQDVGDYPSDGSWVDSPEIIGTEGQSKRIEGFEIKLTGDVPEGMEMRYNVHVQNKGWLYDEDDVTNWPKDGAYAGTRGESLRIEAVKIVLTDSDGKAVSGYSVQYRGHVQNVGDLPADESEWIKDGDQLGTVGSSLRLEALLVKVVKTVVEPVVYDKAGTYGPEAGTEVINGDVIIKADGITLRNLHINGDLYIGTDQVVEKADESTAATINEDQINTETTITGYSEIELQQLYIEFFTKPSAGTSLTITGSPSQAFLFSLPGGTQFTATTPATGAGMGAPMQITAGSSSGSAGGVSVGGAIGSLSLLTPGTQVFLAPGCLVQLFSLQPGALNCGILTPLTGVIQSAVVQAPGAIFSGPGAIQQADIQASGAVFATRPSAFTVAPGVAAPPSMPALPDSGGGGGYTPTQNPVTFSLFSGTVDSGTTVTMSSSGADFIYYTTDGTDPSTATGASGTTKVSGHSVTLTITQALNIKALATRAGYLNSGVTSKTYTLSPSADLSSIVISPAAGSFNFSSTTYDYSNVTVANDVEGITVTPSGNGNGVITVNGTVVASGAQLATPIPVSYKIETTITITNQEQGKAPKTYTIKVTPSSGIVTPIVSKLKATFAATTTPLDLNTSGIFGIKPGTTGSLTNVVFTSSDATVITSGTSADGTIPILKDGTVNLTFVAASVTLDGITYPNVSLNHVVIAVTSTAYLAKVNSGTGTVDDYAAAGIAGVVDGNLSGINQAVAVARAASAGTELNKDAIQTVVADYLAGANNFAVALENSNSKIQTEAFNLNITSAKDSYGNLLSGNKTITVTSDQGDLSYNQAVTFANGTVMVPISLSKIGEHALTVAVNGVIPIQNQAVTVYSKLNFSPANTVSGYDAANGSVVVIPPDNNGIPVTGIGYRVFYQKQSLTAITIPASVTSIGVDAFRECTELVTIVIPKNVTIIDAAAFYNCSKLGSVTFAGDSLLTTIGASAFNACPLTTITNIPAGVTIDPTAGTMGENGDGFIGIYANTAGTYTYNSSTWSKQS